MTRTDFRDLRSRQRRFWMALAIVTCLGLTYPVAVLTQCGGEWRADAMRWLVNDPGFVINLCVLLPTGLALLLSAFDRSLVKRIWKARLAVVVSLSLLLLIALFVYGLDQKRLVASGEASLLQPSLAIEPPVRFREFERALRRERVARESEQALRNARVRLSKADADLAKIRAETSQPTDPEVVAATNERRSAQREVTDQEERLWKSVQAYRDEFNFSGVRDRLVERGSWGARIALFQNLYAALLIAFVVFAVGAILVAEYPYNERGSYLWLSVVIVTLMLWYPLRMYSEWYRSFGVLNLLSYPVYLFVGGVGVIVLVLLFFILARGLAQRLFVLFTGGVSLVASVFGYVEPSSLGHAAALVRAIGPQLFGLLVLIGGAALVLMASVLVGEMRQLDSR
jgi:hypothetical protein